MKRCYITGVDGNDISVLKSKLSKIYLFLMVTQHKKLCTRFHNTPVGYKLMQCDFHSLVFY